MVALAKADPRFALLRRVITRDPEAGGEDYMPVTEAQFAEMEAAGAFALSWPAHGLRYGVPVAVDQQLAEGTDVLANLSRGKLVEASRRFERFLVLSLTAPVDVLAERLAERGRESAEDIAARLKRAPFALPDGLSVIAVDNSGPLDQTVARIRSALAAQPESAIRCSS